MEERLILTKLAVYLVMSFKSHNFYFKMNPKQLIPLLFLLCACTAYPIPDAVDLGLSIKWSSWNLGAASPEGYGEYFAWGETSPKDEYSWENYKWCKGSITTHTKYCYDPNYGYEGYSDNLTVLDLEDDAAHVNLGGPWRMPTMEEWDELRNPNNCEWVYETFNGVRGFRITSKKEGYTGNSIFLPAASLRGNSAPPDYSTGRGNYWSSSPSKIRGYDAYQVDFMPSGINWTSGQAHHMGFSVRPVCQEEDECEYEWVTLSSELLGSTHSGNDCYKALDKPFYFTKLRVDKSVSAGTIVWICMLFLSDSNPNFAAYWSQYRKTDVEYGYMGLSSTMYPISDEDNPTSKYYGKEISNSVIEFDFTKLAQDTYIWGYQMNVNLSGVQAYVKKNK